MRVGLCGLGSAAQRAHLPVLRTAERAGQARLVGVCDPDIDRARSLDGVGGYANVEDLLDRADCELLVIASPPSAHLAAITAAAARGADVLCEKPLGVAEGDAEELEAVVAAHPGLLIATVHQYRFAPAWAEIAALLARSPGPASLEIVVDRPGTDPLSAGGWRSAGRREGGILGDHGAHYLALCHDLEPRAEVRSCLQTGEPGRETAAIDLALGGSRAQVRLSYAQPTRRNLVAATLAGGGELRWEGDTLSGSALNGSGPARRVGALSDRGFVNALYQDLYADLLAGVGDAAWRSRATAQTLGVARLLACCLAASTAPE